MENTKDDKLTINEVKVLSALAFKEMYGLEVIKNVQEEHNTNLYLGTLYNLLSRLDKKGFVTSRWGDDEDGKNGARRRYYKITGLGERVVRSEIYSLVSIGQKFGFAHGG